MKRLIAIFAFLLILVSSSAQTQSEQASFEQLKNLAKTKMYSGDYSSAKNIYKIIYDSYGKYESLTNQVKSDYESCIYAIEKEAIAKTASEKLILSTPLVVFQHEGGVNGVTVSAGANGTSKWEVVSNPEWCSIIQNGNDLSISVKQNPDPKMRVDDITVQFVSSTKKTVTKQISIMQNARPLVSRSVRIITEPEGANVTVGSETYTSPVVLSLKEGDIPINIIRSNYESLDSYITVTSDGDSKQTAEYRFVLKPKFASIVFTMKARSGYIDDKNPQLFIDNRSVDLSPFFGRKAPRSINESMLNRYEIYVDPDYNFIIPVESGNHSVRIVADDFKDYQKDVFVENGKSVVVNAVIEPKQGTIRFMNGGYADGAVIKDGSTPIGVLHGDTEISFTADDHKISFEKPFHVSKQPSIMVHVNPGTTQDIMVDMAPAAYLTLHTSPTSAVVTIDGEVNKRTPLDSMLLTCGEHEFLIEHEKCYPYKLSVLLDSVGQAVNYNIELLKSHKLIIRSDSHKYETNRAKGFNIYLKGENGVYEYDHYSDGSVNVPYGKYMVELRRFSNGQEPNHRDSIRLVREQKRKDLAYRGRINFKEGGRETFYLQSDSYSGSSSFLNGNYKLMSEVFTVENNPALATASYYMFADAGIGKFKVFPGFSTSTLKARAYMNATPAGSPYPKYLFGGSIMFLNGEFRMGGSVSQYADINLLGTYTFDLPVNAALRGQGVSRFNCVNAYDTFFGLELSTRIPSFNVNFRAGYSMSEGAIYLINEGQTERGEFKTAGFVVSAGFTLGGYDSKGTNTIKLFRLFQ